MHVQTGGKRCGREQGKTVDRDEVPTGVLRVKTRIQQCEYYWKQVFPTWHLWPHLGVEGRSLNSLKW